MLLSPFSITSKRDTADCDSAVNRDLPAIPKVFSRVGGGGGAITWPTEFQGGHANLDLAAPLPGTKVSFDRDSRQTVDDSAVPRPIKNSRVYRQRGQGSA